MAPKYVITEPVPTTTTYVRAGRGGAGNTFRAPRSTPATTTTISPSTTTPSSTTRFFSGIGGAGNVHKASERPSPAASLDDELRRLATREEHASSHRGHCGIGGAGNVYHSHPSTSHRKPSDAGSSGSDDARSSMSASSTRSKIWSRITGKEL